MMPAPASLWTLDELSAQVALALATGYPGQANGRVRELPDIRTIRYYTTLGLIDRPAQMRGRTALYGRRHLLQLVAIKRLQVKGLSLVEIQARLAGQTDAALRELAQLPADSQQTVETAETDHRQSAESGEDRRGEAFWGASPAAVPEGDTAPDPSEEVQKNRGRDIYPWVGVPLDEGVILMLEAGRSLDDHDLETLRAAAAPLLKVLRARRLKGS
jgi:DNA-binding transcriptional MerR regulator